MQERKDGIGWRCDWKVTKFHEGEETPYEIVYIPENLLVTAGALALLKGFTGGAITYFDNTHAYIGVGDSSTAAAIGQTDLQASTNKTRVVMDASFPKVGISGGASADNQVIFQATFGSGTANYAWNEWAIFNNSAGGTMLNRKVPSPALGTKNSGETWIIQATITVS